MKIASSRPAIQAAASQEEEPEGLRGDVLEGRRASVLEPRTSRQLTFLVASRRDVEVTLGTNTVRALRVDFTSDQGDDRTVWYDRQGRVLRVEIPSQSYVAIRTDLVG